MIELAEIKRGDVEAALLFARDRIERFGSLEPEDARVLAKLMSDEQRPAYFERLEKLRAELAR